MHYSDTVATNTDFVVCEKRNYVSVYAECFSAFVIHFLEINRVNRGTCKLTRILRIGCVTWQNRKQTRQIVEFISPCKVFLTEVFTSQNINPISPTTKFILGIIQINS